MCLPYRQPTAFVDTAGPSTTIENSEYVYYFSSGHFTLMNENEGGYPAVDNSYQLKCRSYQKRIA